MEICYYWIDQFSNSIKEQGYNFGSQLLFDFNYAKRELTIKENKLYVNGFFNLNEDKRIVNVTAIVGKNGVGKSTFLRALKGLIYDGGILGTHKSGKPEYDYKRILVTKIKGIYKVVFYWSLLSSSQGSINIKFEDNQLKDKFKFEFISYGNGNHTHKFGNNSFHRVDGTESLANTSCIFFSNVFDNTFYRDTTVKERKYFDISTKGILFDIDTRMKLDYSNFSIKDPNQLTNRDKRFNIGILNEFHISEIKSRINLLNDDKSKTIIERHGFLPEKVYLNLDYIMHRQNNFRFINIDQSELLRMEKSRVNYNKIESCIFKLIESIPTDENTLMLAKQTYLLRFVDAYFDDVDRFIAIPERKNKLKNIIDNIEDDELNAKNLLELIEFFCDLTVKTLKDATTPKMKQFDLKFNEWQFKELTKSYTGFIKYFDENVITQASLVNLRESRINFVRTEPDKKQSVLEKDVAIIEVPLSSEGLALLKEFINRYKSINTGSDFIKFQWEGISSGEDTLLGIYSRFFNMTNEDVGENVVILLDEIEHSLHPEWQRRLVSNLLEYLPYVFSDCKSIQIVLSTNVPFLIADIPTKNIVYLERKELENKKERRITSTPEIFTQTFAANIHSLLVNNFFMDSTIGEFSAGKINDIIKILKPEKEGEYNYSRQEIQRVIQTIGEPIIRNKLQSMYSEKFNENVRELEIYELINDFKEDGDYSSEKVNSLFNKMLSKYRKEDKNK